MALTTSAQTPLPRRVAYLTHLTFLSGLWLMAAPSVLTYAPGEASWNDVTIGVLVALLALLRRERAHLVSWPGWLDAFLGAWLLTGAAWLYRSSAPTINDLLAGVFVVLLGACDIVLARRAARSLDQDGSRERTP